MIASCQPNFAILATDGYWNGVAGQKADGSLMDNQDYANSGFSTQASGDFDGATPVATGTLADVAMYYYKTDLRTSRPFSTNNVRTTTQGLGKPPAHGDLHHRPPAWTAS